MGAFGGGMFGGGVGIPGPGFSFGAGFPFGGPAPRMKKFSPKYTAVTFPYSKPDEKKKDEEDYI